MSQRFESDNFIEAAKAYQRIQAPSDLRQKVIEGTAAKPVRNRRNPGKIYKLATLAACMAVAVFSLQTWGPEGLLTESLFGEGVLGTSLIGTEQPVLPNEPEDGQLPTDGTEPEAPGNMARMAEPAGPEPVNVSEPEGGAAAYNPADGAAEPGETEPVQMAAESAGYSLDAEKEPEAADFEEDDLEGLQEFREKTAEPVSVEALFPTMLDTGTSLDDWEVRLVSTAEGSCTVEITGGTEGNSALLTLSKNDESGQWEIKN